MRTLKEVDALRDRLLSDGTPMPEAVRIIAEACMGWPYVYGAWGTECTPSMRKSYARMNPEHQDAIYKACPALSGTCSCSACKWQGKLAFDCRGFTHWCLLKGAGINISGGGATSQYNTAANWYSRGSIGQMPDCVCCVFQQINGRTMQHTGLHVGGGEIIHCSHGVQSGRVTDKGWTHWAIPAGLYTEDELRQIGVITVRQTLRKGARCAEVKVCQELLTAQGYSPGTVDGVYGTQTIAAVTAYQRDHGLTADGICGPMTWAALEAAKPKELYRVTAEHVTYEQYRRILDICPLAEATRE